MPTQRGDGAFEVDGVPKDDGSDNEIETTRPVALVLETAVTQVALPVEEHGAGKSVPGFAFIDSNLDTSAQLRVFHPLQHEKRALDAPDLPVIPAKTASTPRFVKLADDQRSGDSPVPDRCGESEDLIPLRSDQLEVELTADERRERWMVALLARNIEPLVGEVADAGRETKSQQMTERKDMIGEACGVGVVLLNSQIGLVHTRLIAIAQIDLPGLLSASTGGVVESKLALVLSVIAYLHPFRRIKRQR